MGKTLLAQRLLEKLHYPYVSLDHLKMAFIRTKKTSLTVEDDYEMRYFLWPFAAEMIKTAIENKQNMIVEGCYIPGEWKDSFSPEYLAHVYTTFITMSKEYIEDKFQLIKDYASVIEKRPEEQLDMERLIKCSESFRQDCHKYNIPLIDISETFDVDKLAEDIIKNAGL